MSTRTEYQPWMATEFMKLVRGPFGWWWAGVDEFAKAVNARRGTFRNSGFRDPEQILRDYISVSKNPRGVHVWDRKRMFSFDESEAFVLEDCSIQDSIQEFTRSWRTEENFDRFGRIINPHLPAGFVRSVMRLVDLRVQSVGCDDILGSEILRTAHFFGDEEDLIARGDLADAIQAHRHKIIIGPK